MKVILLCSLLISGASSASSFGAIENYLALKLNHLFADTVNEGDQSASVAVRNGAPVMSCQIVLHQINCRVRVDLKMLNYLPFRTCQKECSLTYEASTLITVSTDWYQCLDTINEGC